MAGLNPAYQRVSWQGFTLNRRTRRALILASKKVGFPILLAQGSYNKGGVRASAGTHDGGGAVDIRLYTLDKNGRLRALTTNEIERLLRVLKDLGFAVWHRLFNWDGANGGAHLHALLIGDAEMSAGARSQVISYDANRNGLRNNAIDNSYRAKPRVRFSWLKGKAVPR